MTDEQIKDVQRQLECGKCDPTTLINAAAAIRALNVRAAVAEAQRDELRRQRDEMRERGKAIA